MVHRCDLLWWFAVAEAWGVGRERRDGLRVVAAVAAADHIDGSCCCCCCGAGCGDSESYTTAIALEPRRQTTVICVCSVYVLAVDVAVAVAGSYGWH